MMPWKFIAIYFIILVLRQVTSYQVGPRVLSRPPTSRPTTPPTKQPVPFTRIPTTTTTNQPTIGPAAIATSTPTVQPTEVPR